MIEFLGRTGRRDKETRKRELLKRSKSAGSAYGIGGRKKEGRHAPKPVSLPKFNLPDAEEFMGWPLSEANAR